MIPRRDDDGLLYVGGNLLANVAVSLQGISIRLVNLFQVLKSWSLFYVLRT